MSSSPSGSPTSNTNNNNNNNNNGSWVISYEQMISTQLSRNDLVQLIGSPDQAQRIIPGFFIRVLIELATGQEDYRAYTIRRLVQGRSYSGFSNDRSAQTMYYLELNTPSMLDQVAKGLAPVDPSSEGTNARNGNQPTGSTSTSFQLNCISNSPITQQEYQMWVSEVATQNPDATVGRDPILLALDAGVQHRKQRQQSLWPGLTGPTQRRNRNNNNNNQQQQNQQSNNSPGNNNNNLGATTQQGGGGNLGRTQRDAAVSNNGLRPSNTIVTGAANNAANNHHHHRGGGSGATGQDAAPASLQQQEQLLAAYKRNAIEEFREKYQVFVDPSLYPQTKLAVLRTMERDLGDYIDKLREVVNSKKPACVVCMTNIPSVVFLPCRHMALCRSCAVELVSAKCPLCRETIVDLWEPEEEIG